MIVIDHIGIIHFSKYLMLFVTLGNLNISIFPFEGRHIGLCSGQTGSSTFLLICAGRLPGGINVAQLSAAV